MHGKAGAQTKLEAATICPKVWRPVVFCCSCWAFLQIPIRARPPRTSVPSLVRPISSGKARVKILVLDAKEHIHGAADLFKDAWQRHYQGMIEWSRPTATDRITGGGQGGRR